MRLSNFDFKLPADQIPQNPHSVERTVRNADGEETTFSVKRPDECRMMVVHRRSYTYDFVKKDAKKKELKDENGNSIPLTFADILDYFDEGDAFVFNDTRVIPARLFGVKEKTDANIDVFLLRELNPEMHLWDVLVEPARKIRIGNKIFFGDGQELVAEVIDNTTSRGRTLRFMYDCPHDEFKKRLFAVGKASIPDYILHLRHNGKDTEFSREQYITPEDLEDFQCVYAQHEGAVTAPTTGLHFTRQMMKRLELNGIGQAFITVHSSLSNFSNIEVEDLYKHKMESEEIHVTPEACDIVNKAKSGGRRVCAVGASVLRGVESTVGTDGRLKAYDGWTSKFLFPPHKCTMANAMIVNLYQPKSVMLMATCAFGGYDTVMAAYKAAVKKGFKFGCFGDVMLILDD